MRTLRRLRNRLLGRLDADWYAKRGLRLGQRVHLGPGVRLDPSHCWLITIEDDVTLAPNVTVLAHDASLKRHLDVAYIQPVTIRSGAFVGAGTIILPGVTIGQDAVVGAGAVVTFDVPDRSVAVGNPARTVSSLDDLLARHKDRMAVLPTYPRQGWTEGSITDARKAEQRTAVAHGGYVP